MTTLAERVNRRMAELGLSQAELARRSKVKPPSVAQWRNGHTKTISGEVLLRAAQALKCRAQWLANGVGPIEEAPHSQHSLTLDDPPPKGRIVQAAEKWAPKWPFTRIDLTKLAALSTTDAQQLEGAWRIAAKQLDLDVEVEAAEGVPQGKRRAR